MEKEKFLTIVQLHPPIEGDFGRFAEAVDELEENGITVFDINASRQEERMNSLDVAEKISKPGRTVIPHITARTELRQSLEQVNKAIEQHDTKQFLVMKGDPPENGIFPTTVKEILTSLDTLRKNGERQFEIGATVNQNAKNPDGEAQRLQEKIDQGADFFLSQLVFDIEQAKGLHEFYKKYSDKPLIAGISALKKIGNVGGIVIPEAVRVEEERLADHAELLNRRKISRVVDVVRFIKTNNLAQGIYIAAPIGNPKQVIPYVQELNKI